jgi:hypothetical protein
LYNPQKRAKFFPIHCWVYFRHRSIQSHALESILFCRRIPWTLS